jgi:hypothetical protein
MVMQEMWCIPTSRFPLYGLSNSRAINHKQENKMHTINNRKSLKPMLTAVLALTLIIGCGKKDDTLAGPDGGGMTTPRTPVQQELIGQWYVGTIGLTNFYNTTNGQWTSGRGLGMFYKLNGDGTFEYGWHGQVTNYGCTTRGMVFRRGTVVVGDSTLVMYDNYGRAMGEYTCSPASNFDRPDPLLTRTFVFRRTTDEQEKPALMIRATDGEYLSYKLLE